MGRDTAYNIARISSQACPPIICGGSLHVSNTAAHRVSDAHPVRRSHFVVGICVGGKWWVMVGRDTTYNIAKISSQDCPPIICGGSLHVSDTATHRVSDAHPARRSHFVVGICVGGTWWIVTQRTILPRFL